MEVPVQQHILQQLDNNSLIVLGSGGKPSISKTGRITYKRPLEEHLEGDIACLTKIQLQDICRSYPKKLKVTGTVEELRQKCIAALRTLKDGNVIQDFNRSRKRKVVVESSKDKENVQPIHASDLAVELQHSKICAETVKQSGVSLPSVAKKVKKSKTVICPGNEHFWSFKRGVCVVCNHPKPAEVVIEQPTDASSQETEERALIRKLEGLQLQGLPFVGLRDASISDIKSLKGEQLKVVFRSYHFPQSSHGVALKVDEQKQFLLDHKAAIDRQLERAKAAKANAT